ncbi:hypothetical protein ECTW14313_0291, partial [Escherichia coli O157:H7 str. TW14313]
MPVLNPLQEIISKYISIKFKS